MTESKGCLGGFSGLFSKIEGDSITKTRSGPVNEILPYKIRDDFLSNAELSFYHILRIALEGEGVICPKVSLAELFYITEKADFQRYFNMISRKRVDFVICDPSTMVPWCAIELDDKSHQQQSRLDRDAFVEDLFMQAGIKLLRVPVKPQYAVVEIKNWIQEIKKNANSQTKTDPITTSNLTPPLCPKCGIPMVKRTAQSGPNAGKDFFGCENYPRCKTIIPIQSLSK